MSDTPRTDAQFELFDSDQIMIYEVFAETRKIERELNECERKLKIQTQTQMAKTMAKALDQWRDVARLLYHSHHLPTEYLRARAAFAAMEKEQQ